MMKNHFCWFLIFFLFSFALFEYNFPENEVISIIKSFTNSSVGVYSLSSVISSSTPNLLKKNWIKLYWNLVSRSLCSIIILSTFWSATRLHNLTNPLRLSLIPEPQSLMMSTILYPFYTAYSVFLCACLSMSPLVFCSVVEQRAYTTALMSSFLLMLSVSSVLPIISSSWLL